MSVFCFVVLFRFGFSGATRFFLGGIVLRKIRVQNNLNNFRINHGFLYRRSANPNQEEGYFFPDRVLHSRLLRAHLHPRNAGTKPFLRVKSRMASHE
jgi:hypothetical protein